MFRPFLVSSVLTLASAARAQATPDARSAHDVEEPPGAQAPSVDAPAPEVPTYGTVVTARRPTSAASSETVRAADLASRPISDPSDILEVTPGLLTVQHAGGGKATQYFLRGFDIDHGTDLALSVDGVPVNMVSHGHGQGYADLNFVIPELVERLEVTKGPYLAEQGDFATAGAANLVLKRRFERSEVHLGGGSFGTWRALGIVAPDLDERVQAYAAAELYGSDGPFANPERMRRLSLVGSVSWDAGPRSTVVLQLMAYAGSWNASGQIPRRLVDAGTMSRFGTLDASDGGASQRQLVRLGFTHRDRAGGQLDVFAYLMRYRLGLYSDFTFFAMDPDAGDQIEQVDGRTVSGFEARYARAGTLGPVGLETRGGVRLRADGIENALWHTAQRERLARQVDARVDEMSLGAWAQEELTLTSWARALLGVRADVFNAGVEDRLEDLGAREGATSGEKQAVLLSPKVSLVLTPVAPLDVFLNFGRGFHSNDARGWTRASDPVTPLVPATGYELGARARVGVLDAAVALWALDLASEIVWVGDEGSTEARGPTRRRGVEAELRYKLTPWLRADADVTYTRARFHGGAYVPLAPEWTWSGGLAADHPSGVSGAVRVQGLSDRPANEDGSIVADGFTLLDAEVGYRLTASLRLGLEVRNVLGTTWAQAQFANASRVPGEPEPVEDLHFTPGYPRRFQVTLSALF